MIEKPLIIMGAGGHARVLVAALRQVGAEILGCIDPVKPANPPEGVAWLGSEAILASYDPSAVLLINGVGSTGASALRRGLFLRGKISGFSFASVIHSRAIVDPGVRAGEGVQVMAGAIVQAGALLGDSVLINSGAVVDHDCHIAAHCHVATGAALSGGVTLEESVHVGTGACVIQGIHVGAGAVIAAGAVVIRNVMPGLVVGGIPAGPLRKKDA